MRNPAKPVMVKFLMLFYKGEQVAINETYTGRNWKQNSELKRERPIAGYCRKKTADSTSPAAPYLPYADSLTRSAIDGVRQVRLLERRRQQASQELPVQKGGSGFLFIDIERKRAVRVQFQLFHHRHFRFNRVAVDIAADG